MAAPAAPAASLSLKDQGNDGFRASSWDLSVTFYTQAPSDPTSFTPDDAAALFSNRAAAYIHLFQFDRVGVSLRSFRQVDTRTYKLAVTHLDSPSSLLPYTSASTLLTTRAAALPQARLTPPQINSARCWLTGSYSGPRRPRRPN